jgi:hypothetical protein
MVAFFVLDIGMLDAVLMDLDGEVKEALLLGRGCEKLAGDGLTWRECGDAGGVSCT